MLHGDVTDPVATLALTQQCFGGHDLAASQLGGGHYLALTDFRLAANGFERMLVVAPPEMSPTRAGRISQRLLEIETYRLMALRDPPVAKALGSMLSEAQEELADFTAHLEGKSTSDQILLHALVSLATRVERATAQHSYRFSATRAYATLASHFQRDEQ